MAEVQTADRKARWGWMLFDWATQPFHTLLLTFVFAPYFTSSVASNSVEGQSTWGLTVGIAGIVIAIMAPILGSIADATGPRKPWILLFSVFIVLGSAALWFAVPHMVNPVWVLVAFGIALIGVEFATTFNNAILPDLVPKKEVGELSGSGWALGYVGGLVSLVIMLLFLAEGENGETLLGNAPLFGLDPETREGTRSSGPLTAIWYAVFLIPFFLWVPDVPRKTKATSAVRKGLSELGHTLANLPKNPSLFAYLGSSMFYRDALNGLYTFGGIYAAGVLGWSITSIGIFGIIAAFTGAIGAWVGGKIDKLMGPRPVIVFCVITLMVVCGLIISTSRTSFLLFELAETSTIPDVVFYICGAVIGAAGGSLQAASRTMMVHQAEPGKMTEAFGLYALTGKATSFIAPLTIALVTDITNSQRLGVSPLIVLFGIGLVLLYWVKTEQTGDPDVTHSHDPDRADPAV